MGLIDEVEDSLLFIPVHAHPLPLYCVAVLCRTATAPLPCPAEGPHLGHDALGQHFLALPLPMLPVTYYILPLVHSPLESGQYLLVVLPIELDLPLGRHFGEFFEVLPVELDLYFVLHQFFLHHPVPFLQNNVFLILHSQFALQLGLFCPEVAVLLAEVSKHEFEGMNLVGSM